MRRRLTGAAVGAATVVILVGVARADGPSQLSNFTNEPVKQTVYANDQHMGFSVRSSLIRWLGGVPVASERDVRAAEKERWWGESIESIPPGVVRTDR